jgi:CTP synthase (UTP-ammonia lyase)
MQRISICVIGDYDPHMYTHVALNNAIEHCRPFVQVELIYAWLATDQITETIFTRNKFQAFWIAPGSPYKNDEAVYNVIRWARENDFPILGTCGGFQYMVVEYVRNVLGIHDAGHQETEPDAEKLIISKMSCSLKGQQEEIHIKDHDSWIYNVLKRNTLTGKFNCSYGVNPVYQSQLNKPPFTFTAFSKDGDVRALELKTHRFFNGTLFQPPLDSSPEKPNELILDFINHC